MCDCGKRYENADEEITERINYFKKMEEIVHKMVSFFFHWFCDKMLEVFYKKIHSIILFFSFFLRLNVKLKMKN